jgi:hypothetical protein
MTATPVSLEKIERAILVLRGHKVMLDSDLAALYEVETRVLVQAVKRNLGRFPKDFMFQLENHELAILRSQSVTSSWGGRRSAPYAFTEQGVAMLSTVLNSPRAIAVNIEIMRAFVRLRPFAHVEQGTRPKARCAGSKDRRQILRRFRRDPPADGTTRTKEATDRFRNAQREVIQSHRRPAIVRNSSLTLFF